MTNVAALAPPMEEIGTHDESPNLNAVDSAAPDSQPSTAYVFQFPENPANMTNLPTNQDENPHLHTSQSTMIGSKPTYKPPVNAMQFTCAVYPWTIISY